MKAFNTQPVRSCMNAAILISKAWDSCEYAGRQVIGLASDVSLCVTPLVSCNMIVIVMTIVIETLCR